MTTQPSHISVTDPVASALARVRLVLFTPFDPGKWFTIGFCAWLAFLGEQGFQSGANFNFNNGNGRDFHQSFDRAWEFVVRNSWWLTPVAVAMITLIFVLWLVFVWLNSRGKFMFLHCVALNRADVSVPWSRYAAVADSLFQFRVVLGLLGMILTLPPAAFIALLIIRMCGNGAPNLAGVLLVIALGLATMFIGLLFALIRILTVDFVVPIMFLRQKRCLAVWSEFGSLLGCHFGIFVLYILFRIVLSIAIVMLTLVAVICTCCIAGCFLAIPYIGTVLLLPVLVFKRSYSLCFLAQYGPDCDVFTKSIPPVY